MARILLIDDDHDILRIASRLLSDLNHDVLVFDNGMQALECLEKYSFDMVISDANMPEISGFDIVKKIKSNKKLQHLAVALLTARKEKDDVVKALGLGVDDYLVKPIDPLLFLDKVKALLEKKTPTDWPDIYVGKKEDDSKARIENDLTIERVSEFGLVVSCSVKLNEGDIIRVNGTLFERLKLEAPYVKIINIRPSSIEPGTWIMKTIFVGVKDQFLQKIRWWLNKRFISKKKTAA